MAVPYHAKPALQRTFQSGHGIWRGHFVLSGCVLPLSRETGLTPDISKPTHKFLQGSFNGKPKATFPLSFDETVAFGLPLNELMRPLITTEKPGNGLDHGFGHRSHKLPACRP